MSKENIIANILAGAEAEREELLRAANEEAEKIARADAEFIAALEAETKEKAAKEGEKTVERYQSVAALDGKKLLLRAKQEKIAEVYRRAERALLAMDSEKYDAFVLSLLQKNAEAGDVAVFAEKDERRLSACLQWLSEKGIAYRFDGAFSGGVLLVGKNYDKNATVSALIREYAEGRGAEIARILEGE